MKEKGHFVQFQSIRINPLKPKRVRQHRLINYNSNVLNKPHETRSADLEFEQAEQSHERSERQTIMSVMNILTNWRRWRLMRGAAFLGMPFMESRSRQSLHAHHIKKRSIKPLFYCYY